jgi:hypothetical protein
MEKSLKEHNFENHIQKNDLKLLIELYMVYKHTLWNNDAAPKDIKSTKK